MTATETLEKEKKTEAQGHAAHTKDAEVVGLPGKFQRPIKVTMLGAGSGFTPRLGCDIIRTPTADEGTLALVDIDKNRLDAMVKILQRVVQQVGKPGWKIVGSTNRLDVLPGSDYVTNCIEVSGVDCVAFDNDIPLKYGIDQCIGDTIGPGGLFKSLRTVPVFLDILRDVREHAPNAIVLNYTNPMNIMCLAAGRAVPEVPIVGLCHSVQGTSHLLARYAGVPYEEMRWQCAGINHLAWFTQLEHKGQDLYKTVLYEKFKREIAEGIKEADAGLARYDSEDTGHGHIVEKKYQHEDLVRKDMCVNFGAFITESSGHLSEYLPYYRKSEAGRKLLRLAYHGGSRFYASNWPTWRKAADANRQQMLDSAEVKVWPRSWEYASAIIEAREKNSPFPFHGNVMNRDASGHGSLITNLPSDGCVEVKCIADGNGINPTRFGALPAQMAHVCASNMAMFDLAATACIEKSKEAAIHSLMLDPLTAAVCTPGQVRDMTLELFDAEAKFLPGFK
ncbi:MAG: alpha-glucosidase/alpha-galactosidase [Phycisphaera sp.]|nr:alpha-glucosidase/alpha-galactosidase [Phycisphaera sp.]